MIDFNYFFSDALGDIEQSELKPWLEDLQIALNTSLEDYTHGELEKWQEMLHDLIKVNITELVINDKVSVGNNQSLSEEDKSTLISQLMQLHPWRKGPWSINGIELNTEWRSDWKWQRLQPYIDRLEGRTVLDVGCGNGYHLFRMLGDGARLCIGIDPSQKYLAQFHAMKHFLGKQPAHLLPLGIEQMPKLPSFDTVFSMGVLYHRKSPIEHIQQLMDLLRPGGQLVLETLIVEGDKSTVLVPDGRYAQMRNVWFIPSIDALMLWMRRCGLNNVKLIDCTRTTIEEQRASDWMTFHSLENFLDPDDHSLTIEGYPAPVRAVIVAHKS